MNTILPNMRWLCLPSEGRGEDWRERTLKIDESLQGLALDLAEESVYLLFDKAPGALLHGEGSCIIARSVVGAKKVVERPLQLLDWKSAPVHKKTLKGLSWQEIFEESLTEWENLQRANKSLCGRFSLVLRRRLNAGAAHSELILETEAIFSE